MPQLHVRQHFLSPPKHISKYHEASDHHVTAEFQVRGIFRNVYTSEHTVVNASFMGLKFVLGGGAITVMS
jgi:23S rRNA maturation mini-RNase III